MESGRHTYVLDAKGLTSGMYFYSMEVKGKDAKPIFSSTRKMAFIK